MGFFDKFKDIVGVLVEGKPSETEEEKEEKTGEIKVKGVEKESEERQLKLEKEVNRFINTTLGNYITDYKLEKELHEIDYVGMSQEGNQRKYKVNFMLYGDKDFFDVTTIVHEIVKENGDSFIAGKGYSEVVIGEGEDVESFEGNVKEIIGEYLSKNGGKTGIKSLKDYKGNLDNRDSERFNRMGSLFKESKFNFKAENNDKQGKYIVVNLGKSINLCVTPTVILDTRNNEVIYYKHDEERSSVEKGVSKLVKEVNSQEFYNTAKDFIDDYNKANDLRRAVN